MHRLDFAVSGKGVFAPDDCGDSVGTDPACCAGNFQWLGGGFERYGCLAEVKI